jgi:hypothetical protein
MTSGNGAAKSAVKVVTSDALKDRFGLMVPSALPLLDDEEVMLLRVLGRLEMMTCICQSKS